MAEKRLNGSKMQRHTLSFLKVASRFTFEAVSALRTGHQSFNACTMSKSKSKKKYPRKITYQSHILGGRVEGQCKDSTVRSLIRFEQLMSFLRYLTVAALVGLVFAKISMEDMIRLFIDS